MKILVTGACGQLGYDVMNEALSRGHACIGTDIVEKEKRSFFQKDSLASQGEYVTLDITDTTAVAKAIEELQPDIVVHCAAWTAVDLAEDEENYSKVFNINEKGTENIALACKKTKSKLIYISTDYVFDGNGSQAWSVTDACDPINIYGKSKRAGELAVINNLEQYFIVRISWVFGCNGKNFVKTMLSLGEKYDSLRVVNDQIGSPTYTYDLAKLLIDMTETDRYGVYHATNEGDFISWYDFACKIFELSKMNVNLIPVTTEEYGVTKAKRPYNSRMDKTALLQNGFKLLPSWEDALERYLELIKNNNKNN